MTSDVENAKRGFGLGRDAPKKAQLSEGTSPKATRRARKRVRGTQHFQMRRFAMDSMARLI